MKFETREYDMQAEDIARKLRQRPFVPFKLFLTNGEEFEVRHPEMLVLSRRFLMIGFAKDPSKLIAERTTEIDLLHVVRTEDLAAATAPTN